MQFTSPLPNLFGIKMEKKLQVEMGKELLHPNLFEIKMEKKLQVEMGKKLLQFTTSPLPNHVWNQDGKEASSEDREEIAPVHLCRIKCPNLVLVEY